MTFRAAVESAGEPLAGAILVGKQALKGEHRVLISCRQERRITASIDLEMCLATQGNENRWDYGLGYKPPGGDERAIWVEVHNASTSEVSTVLGKLAWLRNQLEAWGPALRRITQSHSTEPKPFVWLATASGVHIPRHTRQARQLAAAGLDMPRRVLELR